MWSITGQVSPGVAKYTIFWQNVVETGTEDVEGGVEAGVGAGGAGAGAGAFPEHWEQPEHMNNSHLLMVLCKQVSWHAGLKHMGKHFPGSPSTSGKRSDLCKCWQSQADDVFEGAASLCTNVCVSVTSVPAAGFTM